jgi:hypothetical protein
MSHVRSDCTGFFAGSVGTVVAAPFVTFGVAEVAGPRRPRVANPATATIRNRTGSSSPRLAAAIISVAMSSRTTSDWVAQ